MSRVPRLSREDSGNLVYELLTRSDPTLAEACDELDITAPQFRYGIAYVKDILAELNSSPIVVDPITHRYSLALTESEVEKYESLRFQVATTQVKRLLTGTIIPAADKFGTISQRMLKVHAQGLINEIDAMTGAMV